MNNKSIRTISKYENVQLDVIYRKILCERAEVPDQVMSEKIYEFSGSIKSLYMEVYV